MTSTIRAVIFDLGGVLLRTDNPAPRVALAKRLGKTRAELEDIVFGNPVMQQAERGQATQQEAWDEIARRLGLPPEQIPGVLDEFFAGDVVDFSLIRLIQSLRPAYTTALLSNNWVPDLAWFIREKLRIEDAFDVIVNSAQVGMVKPFPEIYHFTLHAVGARPEEAVLVDDAARNIEGAEAVGMHAVHFTGAEQARHALITLLGIPNPPV